MDPELVELLACPVDHAPLQSQDGRLRCVNDHTYPVIAGIPFLIPDDITHPHWAGQLALDYARSGSVPAEWLIPPPAGSPDPFVQQSVGATNGNLYRHLIGSLPRYPIPAFPERPTGDSLLLDVGCGWGRWSFAASRAGFRVIGLDPQPESVFVARRVAQSLGIPATFVVGDARYLPFRDHVFDRTFSFSVLQHLDDVALTAAAQSMRRVLKPGGVSLIQLATLGPRAAMQIARRGCRRARSFEVRYRSVGQLGRLFAEWIGPTRVTPEGFFSLNARREDLDLLTPSGAMFVRLSDAGLRLSRAVPGLRHIADSVWVRSTRH